MKSDVSWYNSDRNKLFLKPKIIVFNSSENSDPELLIHGKKNFWDCATRVLTCNFIKDLPKQIFCKCSAQLFIMDPQHRPTKPPKLNASQTWKSLLSKTQAWPLIKDLSNGSSNQLGRPSKQTTQTKPSAYSSLFTIQYSWNKKLYTGTGSFSSIQR